MSESPDVVDAEPADPSLGGDQVYADAVPGELATLGKEVEPAGITVTVEDLAAEVEAEAQADLQPLATSNAGAANQGGGGRGPGGGGQQKRKRWGRKPGGSGSGGGGFHFSIVSLAGAFSGWLSPRVSVASGNKTGLAVDSAGITTKGRRGH